MSRPEPNRSRDDELIGVRDADDENPIFHQPAPRKWHQFREVGFLVLLHHRGHVIERVSAWTAGGERSAIEDAERCTRVYRIDRGETPLALTAVRRVRTYDLLYVGEGPNPAFYRGSDAPLSVPFYEGYRRNAKTIGATVVWSTLPHTKGEPLSAELAECTYIQGD